MIPWDIEACSITKIGLSLLASLSSRSGSEASQSWTLEIGRE
jgi:hypothetical protein